MKPYVENAFMKKCIAISSWCLLFTYFLSAQNLPIGHWREHFSFRSVNKVLAGGDHIFCAAEHGFFTINRTTKELSKLGKTKRLGDVGVTAMAFSKEHNLLVLGYESGIVDVVSSDGVASIRGIASSSLVGTKKINDIAIGTDRIYLGTAFGVIVAQLEGLELIENYRSIGSGGADVSVQELAINSNQLYAITSEGLQYGSIDQNLLDFTRWTLLDTVRSYHSLKIGACGLIAVAADTSVVQISDTVVNIWSSKAPIKAVDCSEQAIIALQENYLVSYSNGAFDSTSIEDVEVQDFALVDGEVWLATSANGVVTPSNEQLYPNGPFTDQITSISFANNIAYAFYDAVSSQYSWFDKSSWSHEELDGLTGLSAATHYRGAVYLAAAYGGVYDLTNKELVDGAPQQVNDLKVVGGALLGISSTDENATLFSIDREQDVTTYTAAAIGSEFPVSISASANGVIWLTVSPAAGGGVLALDLGGEQVRRITSSDNLASNTVNSLVIDHSDDAWIATPRGLSLMVDASFVFNDSEAFSPIYENGALFDEEPVHALMVDGGNRIWMATDEGVWVFDNNLTRLDEHFTTSNSPLPSHLVYQMEYDPGSGEVYILTDKGLVSYRSESSQGGAVHTSTAVFPNPVLPGYSGMVGITGLVNNASVKITTPGGKLVRSVQAHGGTAAWDLKDYNQHRVAPGVYVIWSASDDGEQTYVGKLAVVD
ncbi:hypothetical protein C7460_103207 [Marinoscillum furvescens DSM 4134]|uniref:PorZ N-terminal beta-propeller domain-containing protein n=2 Tax=Marinoscillum furvescens TaxID=1026 RepID=A0A3D9L689_MARFU|nr:hypothetical protein C7460_103207 [Marinoscillum furvescens DSM 4134]